MSSKPTVTLTLAGDESKLTKAFDAVGDSSKAMADKVDTSSKSMKDSGDAFDSLGGATDDAEGKFQGFADTVTGTGDIMTGFREGDIVGMATGFADLAGGLTTLVVPAMSAFASFLGGPLRTAMTFISSHPLLIALGLLVVAFVTLWTTSETFRNIVIGVFDSVAGFVKRVFGGAIDWIKGAWNGVIDFFRGIPGAVGNALGAIGGFFRDAFKGAANVAIDVVNWMIDRINDLIYGINVINPFADVPNIPHLKRMHGGGVVGGMVGTEQMIIAQAGERLVPRGQDSGGGGVLMVGGNADAAVGTLIDTLFRSGDITWRPA